MLIPRDMARRGLVVGTAALALIAAQTAAADTASEMQAELVAAGVAGAQVSVVTPQGASAADAAAFEQNPAIPGPTLTPENLLSPDPTLPLPIARVAYGPTTTTRLGGLLTPPGIDTYIAVEDAETPVMRLAIMEALKHALGRGAALGGVAMRSLLPSRGDTNAPDLYVAPPDANDVPIPALNETLSAATAEDAIRSGLPVWARAASVSVTPGSGGQRVARTALDAPPAVFAALDVQELVGYLAEKQDELNAEGANIGSVVLRVRDLSAQPLATFAGDSSWGQFFMWMSPIARVYMNPMFASDDASDVTDDVAAATQTSGP